VFTVHHLGKSQSERVGSREGYRRAMEKGDPGVPPMLT
jgi:hypothetical protein